MHGLQRYITVHVPTEDSNISSLESDVTMCQGFFTCSFTYCFKLHNGARFLHHWIFLVMLHKICQVVKFLSPTHVILAVSVVTYHDMRDLVFQPTGTPYLISINFQCYNNVTCTYIFRVHCFAVWHRSKLLICTKSFQSKL